MLIVLLFLLNSLAAQEDWGCDKPNKKAKKYFEAAAELNFKSQKAYGYLIEAIKEDPNYAEALSLLAYLNTKKAEVNPRMKARAADYYEKTREACPTFNNYESSLWLAKYYYSEKEYAKTTSLLDEYISNAKPTKSNQLKEAKTLKAQIDLYNDLFDNPVPFNPKKVPGASTENDEYLPMISPDNQYLFFTRKVTEDTRSIYGKVEKEVFIQSRRKYDGTYSGGIPMPTPFNMERAQGGSSISVDNKLLFITVINQEVTKYGQGYANADIYYSTFYDGSWSELKSIGDHINGRFSWEGQPSISADNQTLYFASSREGNVGGTAALDLYKVVMQENGEWSDPINLGPEINTAGNEKSPFMHSDSYTLYFSSDGHPGVGKQDVFFCHVDKFGKFTPPRNIGVPINTEEDEVGFMVSTDGKYGYFSSNIGNTGLDIYNFELPEYARPDDVIFTKGKIESKDPKAAEGMKIELKNMATNEVTKGVVDEKTGEYVAVIRASEKQDVMMMAKKNGYAFTSQYLNADKNVIGKPVRAAPMEFKPIETGETYRINNVNFATDSYEITQQVANILGEFIEFLNDNPTVKVAIHGHTDDVGDDQKNLELSTNRAKAVYQYLLIEDIDPSRLEYRGYGETKPIASNKTEEGRAKNRRTEFVILSK